MSWFDIAKNALSTAQRSIDKVLEIEEGNGKQQDSKGRTNTTGKKNMSCFLLFYVLRPQNFVWPNRE